jgi:hypothetical protein
MTHIELVIFVWAVIVVSSAQGLWFAWYLLWPRITRIMHCPWCWKQAGIEQEFPAPWTSMLCAYHQRQQRAALAACRLARQRATAPTRPAAVVPTVMVGVSEVRR